MGHAPTGILDLDHVPPGLHAHAREAIAEGDGGRFAGLAPGRDALALVADNAAVLRRRGAYEAALLAAFTRTRTNTAGWSLRDLGRLFGTADRARLRAAGDPLPGPGPFPLHRGVAGVGRARRPRGYSWTGSLDVACWFATRRDLPAPAVFTATVPEGDVLAYVDGRGEQEYVCRPDVARRLAIDEAEIGGRARRLDERRQRQVEAWLAEPLAGLAGA